MIDIRLEKTSRKNGIEIYRSLVRDFPHENYIIYSSQDLKTFRDQISELLYRDVQVVLLDEVLKKRNIRFHLSRIIRPGKENKVFLAKN